MYVGNSPPQSSVTRIPQAVTDSRNAKMIPMGTALQQAMRWPCFAPSTPYSPANGFGPAVVADAAVMQSLVAASAATSLAASAGDVQVSDMTDPTAPTVVPLNPYDFLSSTPVQTPQTIKSCPSPSANRAAPLWGSASSVRMNSGAPGVSTWLLVGLAALGLYGWSQAK